MPFFILYAKRHAKSFSFNKNKKKLYFNGNETEIERNYIFFIER